MFVRPQVIEEPSRDAPTTIRTLASIDSFALAPPSLCNFKHACTLLFRHGLRLGGGEVVGPALLLGPELLVVRQGVRLELDLVGVDDLAAAVGALLLRQHKK